MRTYAFSIETSTDTRKCAAVSVAMRGLRESQSMNKHTRLRTEEQKRGEADVAWVQRDSEALDARLRTREAPGLYHAFFALVGLARFRVVFARLVFTITFLVAHETAVPTVRNPRAPAGDGGSSSSSRTRIRSRS